jgi:hypothetical protein
MIVGERRAPERCSQIEAMAVVGSPSGRCRLAIVLGARGAPHMELAPVIFAPADGGCCDVLLPACSSLCASVLHPPA